MPKTILTSDQLNTLIDHRNTLTLILAETYSLADAARQAGAADLEQHLYTNASLTSRARHGLEKAILWGAADPALGENRPAVDEQNAPKQGAVR